MKRSTNIVEISGLESANYIDELSRLRIEVFRDFPYLYDGNLNYEKKYLQTYFSSQNSFLVLCHHNAQIVGASTAIAMAEEESSFKSPIEKAGINTSEVCYFGESVLLKSFRGQGIGKKFMESRENFAKRKGFKFAMFCAVMRPDRHPLKPQNYKPLDAFWQKMNFSKLTGVTCEYSWKDLDQESETVKPMQFWIKKLEN